VKKSRLDCKFLFISPPSMKELENRLKKRGTETMEKVKIRLEQAVNEIAYSQVEGNFDWVIINDDLDETFASIIRKLEEWFPQLDLYTRK
jgi:guanylate kinase